MPPVPRQQEQTHTGGEQGVLLLLERQYFGIDGLLVLSKVSEFVSRILLVFSRRLSHEGERPASTAEPRIQHHAHIVPLGSRSLDFLLNDRQSPAELLDSSVDLR